MCYGFEVDLLRVDFGLFYNLRFFCSFLNQLHNSVLGVAAGGQGWRLEAVGMGRGAHLQTQAPPTHPATQKPPPPPGPWRVWVCVCVCMPCPCARGQAGEGGVRVCLQAAAACVWRRPRAVCVSVCERGGPSGLGVG
ncbi:unnamed protein product [Rangifer tarandus platyrhynchus]|uniref:Uncharacterized protein n=1 Tax=Rangifer tarandus platyrhynchus TaxID=3082113 RepID=A0ABN8Z7V3_RANTA|nr:unnamed protein product [Rangifer tarandus platyrhynchus]